MADSKQPSSDAQDDASPEEIARALGMQGSAGSGPDEKVDDPSAEGRLQLDKDGALIGRRKLDARKAIREGADEIESDEDVSETEAPDAQGAPSPEGKPRRAAIPPRLSLLRPDDAEDEPAPEAEGLDPTPEAFRAEVFVPGGTFRFGESQEQREVAGFHIDRYPITNRQYEVFVRATGHRPPMYWPSGHLPEELFDHPVVGVDYYDALAYAQWKGKDLPFEDEWEYAARGGDGRTFPWGEMKDPHASNTARTSLKMTCPVDAFPQNVSPHGVHDMVGNAWEMTHSPAPGGGIVVRGGSWYDFALYAKTWFRFATRPDARNGTIGFRCVRRADERGDAKREVDPAMVEAEILARIGPQPPIDTTDRSPERRDLVPDYRKLSNFLADLESEALRRTQGPLPTSPGPAPLTPEGMEALPTSTSDTVGALGAGVLDSLAAAESKVEDAAGVLDDTASAAAEVAGRAAETVETEAAAVVDGATADAEAAADDAAASLADALTGGATTTSDAPAAEQTTMPREHVRDDRLKVRQVADEAIRATASADAPRPAEPAPERTPLWLWGLLLLGFGLLGWVGVKLINQDAGEAGIEDDSLTEGMGDGTDPIEPLRDPREQLPTPRAAAGSPLPILDASDDDAFREFTTTGKWIAVFVDPTKEDVGLRTLRNAHAMGLRLTDTGVRFALVIPRRVALADDGTLPGPEALALRLRQMAPGLNTVTIILDRPGPDGRDVLRKKYLDDDGAIAAVAVNRGRKEFASWAPRQRGFTELELVPIVRDTLERFGNLRDGE